MYIREMELPSAEVLKAEIPLPPPLKKIRNERIKLIEGVLSGREEKLLVIVGPCSAHEPKSVLDYAKQLGKLNEQVKDKLVLVPRIYTNKPRTKGVGYKGMFFQPDLNKSEDILSGIRAVRELHRQVMEVSGLGTADEMLIPESFEYMSDLIAYTVIGARTSESPQHRMTASGLDLPVGVKNPMSGSIPALLNSVYAVQSAQTFLYGKWQTHTSGNGYAHAILRGRVDYFGKDHPNYSVETVQQVLEEYQKNQALKNPAVIIDANHSNSGKRHKEQIRIVGEVLKSFSDKDFRSIVKGFMIESFLEEGNQTGSAVYGKSITDPCLGWSDTERLILDIAEKN